MFTYYQVLLHVYDVYDIYVFVYAIYCPHPQPFPLQARHRMVTAYESISKLSRKLSEVICGQLKATW